MDGMYRSDGSLRYEPAPRPIPREDDFDPWPDGDDGDDHDLEEALDAYYEDQAARRAILNA